MSRSGYSDDYGDDDPLALGRYRAQVNSSIRGKRGQAFLREMVESLDAMPEKRLVAWELQKGGEVCAIGSVGVRRGVDMAALDPEDAETVAATLNIATPLAREIVYENDERRTAFRETPEERWIRMRAWAASLIRALTNEPKP